MKKKMFAVTIEGQTFFITEKQRESLLWDLLGLNVNIED
jgi:hypothetical protein